MDIWNYSIFWQEAIKQIEETFREESKEQEFSLWFTIEYIESKELTIVAGVPSLFFRDQLEKRGYINIIQEKLFELSGQHINVELQIKIRTDKNTPTEKTNNIQPENEFKDLNKSKKINNSSTELFSDSSNSEKKQHLQLNPKYTFDSFVIGDDANSFTYNAALAVAKNPGHQYNPILIYGGVGLGKTHLMQSIGNYVHNERGGKIIYISAENFTNEFIQSLNNKSIQKFKNKYRSADVLLLDDIHFLQNKEGTQEELFHTFNALYESYKQIVFTCDRPVSELKNLTERLKNRFERGLNVDLQLPSYETRRAIIEKKLEIEGKKIDKNVIDLIAHNIETNVRDIESSITKILAYTELVNKELTVEIAQQLLRDTFNSPHSEKITIENIQRSVAENFGISYTDIKSKKQTKKIVLPRQIAMYIARDFTEFSTTEIGIEFGGRDHSTVMHSIDKIEQSILTDSKLDATIQAIKRNIKDFKKN